MLRVILATLACLLLEACSGWASDERLFGDGDWAHLDINGRYKNDDGESDGKGILRTLPNGLIEIRSADKHDKDVTRIGLVPIRGGSGEYFLMVGRSDPTPDDDEGDTYLIVRVTTDKSLKFYLPDCRGTSDVEGMTREFGDAMEASVEGEDSNAKPRPTSRPSQNDENVICKFSTKGALMTAGLEAERFLAAKHVVEIRPFSSISPDEEASEPATTERPTRRPPPRRSRR
jgi:hypothetical protein